MSIEKLVLAMSTHYHANLIDIHNALHALGLRSDEQAEEFNKKHVMKLQKENPLFAVFKDEAQK